MKKIMLACAGGFSTSMLVEKMKEAARKRNLEVAIDAVAEVDLANHNDIDIIMLGPQMGHAEDAIKAAFDIPVVTIDMMMYGMMDGEKVLDEALKLLEK